MKNNDDFDLVNLPEECRDPEITQDDFVLTNVDKDVKEQKFQTKPTTFFKDSMKRFAKNKSSVVAAFILGFLILLSIIVPLVSPYDVINGLGDTAFSNLEPKLFENANGFWDGTVKEEHIAVDTSNDDQSTWLPDPSTFKPSGIKDIVYTDVEYTSSSSRYGREGYLQVGFFGVYGVSEANLDSRNVGQLAQAYRFSLDLTTTDIELVKFETVDENKIRIYEDNNALTFPENYELGLTSLEFVFIHNGKEISIPLAAPKTIHNIGITSMDGYISEASIDVNEKILANEYVIENSLTKFDSCNFRIKVVGQEHTDPSANVCGLVRNLVFSVNDSAPQNAKNYFSTSFAVSGGSVSGISFTDAMEMASRTKEVKLGLNTALNTGYWTVPDMTNYVKNIYLGKCRFASFTYDTYYATLGVINFALSSTDLEAYKDKGWIDFDIEIVQVGTRFTVNRDLFEATPVTILSEKCPLTYKDATSEIVFEYSDIRPDQNPVGGEMPYTVDCRVTYYRYLGYDEMPSFLFGTDANSKDMFKYVFDGLKNSLSLGLLTFVICFLFGLFWGAVSGYFGGAVDLIMERLTDILSGIPWIVLMTLVILKTGQSNFGTFLLALCLTGWIGTASTTRTQFYRFRGREYVLASRTLGASHARLIAKHILPNALGTIITGAVLMIPSVIFSEATISYLGLGFQDASSLGVILSTNQANLTSRPYQLIFPSIVIALVMISFNLFGNGLRDAINPSLKGEEE